MRVSDKGKFALAIKEGLVPAPYLDSVGVWTFGVGHAETSGIHPNPRNMARGMPADLDAAIAEALRLFSKTLEAYERAVERAVRVPIAQHEFDALVSFHYNTGGISRAALTRHLNAGNRAAAAQAFMGWLKPPEIRGRREAEMVLFRDGKYPTGSIPVYSVTASNKPGRIIKRIGEDEALRLMGSQRATQGREVHPVVRPWPDRHMPPLPDPAPEPRNGLAAFFAAILRFLKGDA